MAFLFLFLSTPLWASVLWSLSKTGGQAAVSGFQIIFFLLMGVLGLAGAGGTTILGWVAVAQIRRSAGKLHGMWLAVFDGLLFPLLALDFGIAWGIHKLGIAFGWWTQNYTSRSDAILTILSIAAWLMVDWLIIRRVWRAVNNVPKTDALPAIEAWLALMDKGDYAGTWQTASPGFRMVVNEATWVGKCVKIRQPLGNVMARQLKSSGTSVFGRLFKAQFATRFDGGFDAVETVTFSRQPDGSWKAITYIVRIGTDLAQDWRRAFWIVFGVMLGVSLLTTAINTTVNAFLSQHSRQGIHAHVSKLVSGESSFQPAVESGNLSFGPVVERVVDMAKPGGLDLESGTFKAVEPESMSKGPEWSQQAGIDLIVLKPEGTNAVEISGLIFVDARPSEVDVSFWQKSAAKLLASPSFAAMLKLTAEQAASPQSKIWWRETRNKRDAEDTPTYVFKTREGGMGILQITGFTENPRGVKIRYKLVQDGNENR